LHEGSPGTSHEPHQDQQRVPLRMSSSAVRQSSRLQYMQHMEQAGEVGGDVYGNQVPPLQLPPQQQQQQQSHLVLHPPQSPVAAPATLPDSPAKSPLPLYAPPDILTPSHISAHPDSQAPTPLSHLSPRLQQQYPPAQGPPQPPPPQELYHHPPDHSHHPRTAHTAPSTSLTGADLQGSTTSTTATAAADVSASRKGSDTARSASTRCSDAGEAQAHLEGTDHHPPDPHQPNNGWQLGDAWGEGQDFSNLSHRQDLVGLGSPEGSASRPGSASHEQGGASQRGHGITGVAFASKGSLSRQNRVAPVL